MRRGATRMTGAQLDFVTLIEPKTIPKTPSGKVQRQRCRTLLLERRLDIVSEWLLTGRQMPAPRGSPAPTLQQT